MRYLTYNWWCNQETPAGGPWSHLTLLYQPWLRVDCCLGSTKRCHCMMSSVFPRGLKELYYMRKCLVKVCYGVLAPGRAECAPPPCTRGARWCAAAASAPGGGSQSVAECGDRYTGYIYSVDTLDISTHHDI